MKRLGFKHNNGCDVTRVEKEKMFSQKCQFFPPFLVSSKMTFLGAFCWPVNSTGSFNMVNICLTFNFAGIEDLSYFN